MHRWPLSTPFASFPASRPWPIPPQSHCHELPFLFSFLPSSLAVSSHHSLLHLSETTVPESTCWWHRVIIFLFQLVSLSDLQSIHAVTNDRISLLIPEYDSMVYIYHIFFNHQMMGVWVVYFFATMNTAVINTHMQKSFWCTDWFPLHTYPAVALLDHTTVLIFVWICVHVCAYICVRVCVLECLLACGGQRLTSVSLTIFVWSQSFSVNLGFANLMKLAGQ